jgi:hypothetical protein
VEIYGHKSFPLHLPSFVHDFSRRLANLAVFPGHDAVVDLLVDFAEAESAFADARLPDYDDEREELVPWRAALDSLSSAFCALLDEDGSRIRSSLETCRAVVGSLPIPKEAEVVQARTAEGFACYALYPEQYVDAAQQLAAICREQPVVCVGLRSIGSVLAAVVAAALRSEGVSAEIRTVRPRGHPFDRRVSTGAGLRQFLRERSSSNFAVIDEGPGISGSSFASAVDALRELDVPEHRIALLPSWSPNPDTLRSERARRAFRRLRVIVGASPIERIAGETLRCPAVFNVSAGAWRSLPALSHASTPAVQPQHERVKFVDNPMNPSSIARFAGLGRHGALKLRRAELLHQAGFGPAPVLLSRGVLVLDWLDGSPRVPGQMTQSTLERTADYIGFIARTFAIDEEDHGDDLVAMLRQNAFEGLGPGRSEDVEALIEQRPAHGGRRTAVDGRMLAHEWIAHGERLMKVDALDHHADDFLPGCRDSAWDVAGACVEWRLRAAARQFLVDAVVRRTGDGQLIARLPFLTAAYLAYRLGYTTMAADSLPGTPDGARFIRLRERYRRSLAAHAAHPHPARGR